MHLDFMMANGCSSTHTSRISSPLETSKNKGGKPGVVLDGTPAAGYEQQAFLPEERDTALSAELYFMIANAS